MIDSNFRRLFRIVADSQSALEVGLWCRTTPPHILNYRVFFWGGGGLINYKIDINLRADNEEKLCKVQRDHIKQTLRH